MKFAPVTVFNLYFCILCQNVETENYQHFREWTKKFWKRPWRSHYFDKQLRTDTYFHYFAKKRLK